MSTFHDAIVGKTGKVDHRSGVEIIKPCLTIQYNKHMGGVDRVDQQLHLYNFLRKSYKWYNRKLVISLFSQAVLNSHKVYQKTTLDTKMTFFNF